jgi:hypothetical protein
MNNTQALTTLIDHVSASDKPVNIGWDEVAQWRDGLLKRFAKLGLIDKDVNAQSLECMGCEHRCFMDVLLTEDSKRAFIVCNHPEMQSQMGRINVPLERLKQWQTSARQFAVVIAGLLGFDTAPAYQKNSASYKLGMLKGNSGRRCVSLVIKPLQLEISGHTLPVIDLLYFNDNELAIDVLRIASLLDLTAIDTDKAYTPNISKQETRKRATQAMRQNWRDKYQVLLLEHPYKTDEWYSMQISKLPIANGRSAETIRKDMKK